MKLRIIATCISEQKGIAKTARECITLTENHGIEQDAHAGTWHRQVSLLSLERIEEFRKRGAEVDFGAFGENLIVEGADLKKLPVGTRLKGREVLLEVTQIGKECHDHCAIYYSVGDCIMPREGIFAKVLHGGTLRAGDELQITDPLPERPFTAAVITLSDRCYAGRHTDTAGPAVAALLTDKGYDVVEQILLPDDKLRLKNQLLRLADQRQVSVIFTTGGTGFSPRDITPEVTQEIADRNAPGIAEALRAYSMTITKKAMLSRAASVIRGTTLIVNLPGSEKAVREELGFLLDTLDHGLEILRGTGDN